MNHSRCWCTFSYLGTRGVLKQSIRPLGGKQGPCWPKQSAPMCWAATNWNHQVPQFSVDDWLWVPQRHMLVSHLLLTLMWASAVRVMIPTFHGEAFKLAKSVPLSRLGSQPAVMCSSKLILTNTIGEKGRAAQARASLSLVVFDKTKFQDTRTISRRVYFSGSWPVSAQRRKPERQGPNQIRGPQVEN